MKLKNIKKVPFEIAQILASNKQLIQLIYDDSADLTTEILPSATQLINEEYIGFYPATETGINSVSKNTFLIINLEDISLQNQDSNIGASGAIYITTDRDHCLIKQKEIRLLEIADTVEGILEGYKLSSAGQIRLTSINYVVFSDFRSGYRINFRIYDQPTRKAEL